MSAQTQGRHEHDFEEPNFEFIAPKEDYTAELDISIANVPVSTASVEVSIASPEVKTAAESLVDTSKLQLEQERLGLEEALRLQEQLNEEERQRIAKVHEEASTFNAKEWDNIQAQIKADEELAHRYVKKGSTEDMGEDSAALSDSHSTPIMSQPSSSKPQKNKSRRKQRKDNGPTEPVTDEAHVSTPSYDPPQSGKDSMQLSELMNLCTNLQEKVLDLEKAKTTQAKEITSLKKRVKQLEKRRKSRPSGLRRLRKVGSSSRVESSNDASLGAQEDASKQGRKLKILMLMQK
ncbi:hypothetical protein Tco_0551408 [Tanacetum coccineum]